MTDGFRIEWIETAKLKPSEYNPRKDLQPSDPEYIQIQKSINEFGLVDPLVVNSDMTVIGGHQRLKVLTGAGFEKVPCSIVTLDKTKEKALNIALNKISGEWDFPKLKDLIVELDTGGFDLDAVGWTPKELDDVFSKLGGWRGEKEEDFDVDEAIEQIKEPVSKRGDIWLCGRHRIMCGDSTNAEDVGRLMDGKKADMVFTDPPYGMNLDTDYSKMPRGGKKYPFIVGDDLAFNPSSIMTIDAEKYCIWGADWFYSRLEDGFSPIVWDKQPFHIEAGPQNHFELCWVKPKEKRRIVRYLWTGFTAKEKESARVHPAQKPVAVCIDIMGKGWNCVIDPFLGSGSTLIAAEQTNRICYGMEIEPLYVDVSVKRWEEYTGLKAELNG